MKGFFDKLKTAGYTQSEIAEKAGITQGTIAKYINGTTQPSIQVVIALADAFEVSTDIVLGRAEGEVKVNKKKRWQRKKITCSSTTISA